MNQTLNPLLGSCVLCYLDDILVYSPTLDQHIKDVESVLQLLNENKLYIKLRKCELFKNKVSFLGHQISAEGVSVEEDKIKAIRDWPIPQCVRDIQSFHGTCSYYRKFIKDFAKLSSPLTDLLRKDVSFSWGRDQQSAFDKLKYELSHAPILKTPDYSKEFTLTTDASRYGIGGVLTQNDDNGNERPIAYFSQKLKPQEQNWSTYEQECFAIVASLKHFRHYCEGNKINIFTDHKALIHINNQPKLTAKQARWISYISLFNYSIGYREGKANKVADGLSRQHNTNVEKENDSHYNDHHDRLHLSNVISYENKARSKLHLQLSLIDTTIQSTLLDDIKNAQIKDNQCVRYLHGEINLNSNTNNHFSIDSEHNLVLYNNRYYIPNNNILRNKLLKQFHDNSGHIGVQKTHELISRQVYWKNLYDDIVEYVKQCIPCQRNKPSNQRPHGLLQPL